MIKKYSTILIDGYNCLLNWVYFKQYSKQSLDNRRQRLVTMLENLSSLTDKRIIIVFDGIKSDIKRCKDVNVKIVFSRKGITADSVIENYLVTNKNKTLVISSDRDMSSVCILRGANVLRSEEFEKYILEYLDGYYDHNFNKETKNFGNKVKSKALMSLLEDLKDEKARFEKEKLLNEIKNLKQERKKRKSEEEKELKILREGTQKEDSSKDDEEALQLFHAMYGDKKTKNKAKRDNIQTQIIVKDENFDWESAMENSLKDFDPDSKK